MLRFLRSLAAGGLRAGAAYNKDPKTNYRDSGPSQSRNLLTEDKITKERHYAIGHRRNRLHIAVIGPRKHQHVGNKESDQGGNPAREREREREGISSLITFFIAYMLVLSWADYSYVQPVSSVAYGVVALLGYLVLGEKISALRWAGIAVICLGVFVVSRTGPQTTSRKTAEEA